MRIAWFSPMPPSHSGIAAYSAELLPLLRPYFPVLDVFVDRDADPQAGLFSAHDFVWKQRRAPYDLTVFQMGNASCHDYMWAYAFRYPGLVVLHDAQLHQARALWLTRRWKPRRDDYLAEFAANHPEAPADLGELVAAGLGGSLYAHWPMIRLLLERARGTVVHNARVAADLRERYPQLSPTVIEMGVADPLAAQELDARAADVRRRLRIPADAAVIAAFGGITPEKRIGPLIRAVSAIAERHPALHLMLVGGEAGHYDARQEAERWGVGNRLHLTGFVPDDALPSHLAAADLCACLRWPTNRETSASWLRCLAAARPTIVTDLTHMADVPTIDPRGWRVLSVEGARDPVAVSIDILDEEHSLQLALERLATDDAMRAALGAAGRAWWAAHHQLQPMADAYVRALRTGADTPAGTPLLPLHLTDDGSSRARALASAFGTERANGIAGA